jgi:hypothetical protein
VYEHTFKLKGQGMPLKWAKNILASYSIFLAVHLMLYRIANFLGAKN